MPRKRKQAPRSTLALHLLPQEIIDAVRCYLPARSMLLLHMTCTTLSQHLSSPRIWTEVWHHDIVSRKRGRIGELEFPHVSMQMVTESNAHRMCGLLTFIGCERCARPLVRKVYMPFMLRLCQLCFLDITIRQRCLPDAFGGGPQVQDVLGSSAFTQALRKLAHRQVTEMTQWGPDRVTSFLRRCVHVLPFPCCAVCMLFVVACTSAREMQTCLHAHASAEVSPFDFALGFFLFDMFRECDTRQQFYLCLARFSRVEFICCITCLVISIKFKVSFRTLSCSSSLWLPSAARPV
jgi:hypothetical protein